MAAITKVGVPSLASVLPPQNDQLRGVAAEDIAAYDPCYISGVSAVDGMPLFTRSNGVAATAVAKVLGYATAARKSGEPLTIEFNVVVRYGSGMTPGPVYLGATVGALDTAATTGGTAPIGHIIDATRIQLWQSRY